MNSLTDPRRQMPPLTPHREYRLRRRVPLIVAAVHAQMSLSRASEIERFPNKARPGELERLRKAVDQAAKQAGTSAGSEAAP
jgi:hypothetical protein